MSIRFYPEPESSPEDLWLEQRIAAVDDQLDRAIDALLIADICFHGEAANVCSYCATSAHSYWEWGYRHSRQEG